MKWRLVNLRMVSAGRGLDRRRNVGREAAAVRELRVEQRVVFVEPFAQVVGDHFEAGAQTAGVEGNAVLALT